MPDYLAHEGLEHAERAREHLENPENPPPLPMLRGIPLTAAILAVCAGLSSLYGNRLSEAILIQSNDAILAQAAASDTWAQYQAESLKAHLAATAGEIATSLPLKKTLTQAERVYRDRQGPLEANAKRLEREESGSIELMERTETKKMFFDIATAIFQISIVLASIAAMTRRSPLFIVSLVGGVIGLVSCVVGFVR